MDELGNRMKGYERVFTSRLMNKTPVIIRVDGRAFSTFTKRITPENDPSSKTGFSDLFNWCMENTALAMVDNIQNAVMAYTQSDEISILLNDWNTHETEQWFGGNRDKIVSITSAMASSLFYHFWTAQFDEVLILDRPLFDSRAFNLTKEEVPNYFIWRQMDAERNSVNYIARKHFSQRELYCKNRTQVLDMLFEKGVVWSQLEDWEKRGTVVVRDKFGITNTVVPTPRFVIEQDFFYDLLR